MKTKHNHLVTFQGQFVQRIRIQSDNKVEVVSCCDDAMEATEYTEAEAVELAKLIGVGAEAVHNGSL